MDHVERIVSSLNEIIEMLDRPGFEPNPVRTDWDGVRELVRDLTARYKSLLDDVDKARPELDAETSTKLGQICAAVGLNVVATVCA